MSTQIETSELNDFLLDVHHAARSGAGLDDAAVHDESLADAAAGVALAGVIRTLRIPITNGSGSQTTDKLTTWGVTIEGKATIMAPTNGTWSIKVVDLVYGTTVFQGSGITANKPISFSYKTGFHCQLQANAQWSVGGNTLLVLQLDTNH